MIENIAISFAEKLLNDINKIMNDTKRENKMTDFDHKYSALEDQIVDFYDILERADYEYSNEIDNEYMNIILTEIWMLNLTEDQSYDLEYLAQYVRQRADKNPDGRVYSAKELECLYEVLSSFKDDLFKKHNINSWEY